MLISGLKTRLDALTSLSSGILNGQDELMEHVSHFNNAFRSSEECICQLRLLVLTSLTLSKSAEIQIVKRDTISTLEQCLLQMKNNYLQEELEIITLADIQAVVKAQETLSSVVGTLEASQKLCCVDHACLPRDIFDTCVSSIYDAIEISQHVGMLVVKKSKEGEKDINLNDFISSSSKSVELALLTIQTIHKSSSLSESIEKVSTPEVSLWGTHKRFCQEAGNFEMKEITISLKKMTEDLLLLCNSCVMSHKEQTWVSAVAVSTRLIIKEVYLLSLSRLGDAISFFQSTTKLQYILLRVFRTLVSKGYCGDNQKEEDVDGEGSDDVAGMRFDNDDVEGTGMGEGDGKQDVTDQLESEEQLLGLKEQNQNDGNENNDESKQLEEEEAKQGMEMEGDFEGEMFDVPEDTMEEKEDGDEDEDEEELDREMGDGANQNEKVIDEKMWNDSDDENETNYEEEKFETDNGMKGESIEDEMRTKEDGANGEESAKPEMSNSNDQLAEQEEHTQHSDENDSVFNEDNYDDEQNGIEVRENEEEHQEEGEDGDMDLGDNINISDDQNTGDDSQQPNEEMDEETGTEEHQNDTDMSDSPEEPDEMEKNSGDEQEDDVIETTAIHNGATGEQDNEEEQDASNIDHSGADNPEHDENEAFGVRSKDGSDRIKEHVTEEEEEEEDALGGQDGTGGSGDKNDGQQDESSCPVGDGGGMGGDHIEGPKTEDIETEKSGAPNPFKNPGDVSDFWHRKLQMVDRQKSVPENNRNDEELPSKEDIGNDEKNHGEFEYSAENETFSTQVMGETTEETSTILEDEINSEEQPTSTDEAINELNKRKERSDDEQKSSKKSKKTATSSNHMNHNQQSNQEETDTDTESNIDELTHISQSDDQIDDTSNEERENRVISDLNQVQNDDSESFQDHGEIVEENQIIGISNQEEIDSRAQWNKILNETNCLSRRLCEQLRLVMEPLLATKLKGDYRTGKRINMKRVIGYIASGYRNDKIWLRRRKPAKRNYRILLAVDNSESMSKNGAGEMALTAMATLATGMSHLEIGELGIASFGDEMRLLHPFHLPFTSESGSNIIHSFPFNEKRTRTALCVESALNVLEMQGGNCASMQLVFLISDGRIERDSRSSLRRLMREMTEKNILLVMIVVESQKRSTVKEGEEKGYQKKRDSITTMKEVTFENGKPKVKQFIEDYPFPYYILLEDMQTLPEVLGNALRQWFEMIAQLQHNS
eukprot:CAMPEP_0194140696 /NCGR_PEP_ID=MMETSP0152-20130528/10216_1 /TAXON_ID=1049557 /ORGANISM="Thalassiothrix antarctica, Strain L6-D1" /LENGTH=1225 /DNA_ID=CAMNT_0038839047 /DNA_START=460 /DNA_END=4137 /DNA_ORIENTATION=+